MTNEMGLSGGYGDETSGPQLNEQEGEHGRMDRIRNRAHDIRTDPRAFAQECKETARQKAHQLKEKWDNSSLAEMEHSVEHYMRENPGKSLGIAAGVGFLVGLMVARRRH